MATAAANYLGCMSGGATNDAARVAADGVGQELATAVDAAKKAVPKAAFVVAQALPHSIPTAVDAANWAAPKAVDGVARALPLARPPDVDAATKGDPKAAEDVDVVPSLAAPTADGPLLAHTVAAAAVRTAMQEVAETPFAIAIADVALVVVVTALPFRSCLDLVEFEAALQRLFFAVKLATPLTHPVDVDTLLGLLAASLASTNTYP